MTSASLHDNKPTEKDLARLQEMLDKVFVCRVCGGAKHHTRLNGYICHNPRCAEIEREMEMRLTPADLRNKRR